MTKEQFEKAKDCEKRKWEVEFEISKIQRLECPKQMDDIFEECRIKMIERLSNLKKNIEDEFNAV